ncbi:hypothetical protein LCGC14_2376310 [marine sediment metagenome]|uniref:Uncharacterized protein n=1 Tax=marine sediment metagenome TaxID=412755 RepID=A0A0F9EEQ4_9ZZZZ
MNVKIVEMNAAGDIVALIAGYSSVDGAGIMSTEEKLIIPRR